MVKFSILFSQHTGTGSGLGTSVLNLLAEEYPEVYRFTTAVYPSADDDVITSPYNRYMYIDTGLKESVVWLSKMSRFFCWASNFSFPLSRFAMAQASCLPTKYS